MLYVTVVRIIGTIFLPVLPIGILDNCLFVYEFQSCLVVNSCGKFNSKKSHSSPDKTVKTNEIITGIDKFRRFPMIFLRMQF